MTSQEVAIARVMKAVEAIKSCGMVIMVDDEDRENEGDLVFAATHVTPEKINFMTKEARGLICLTLEATAVDRLNLPMMQDGSKRGPSKSTAFTVSIEARDGVTTGISAADRAHTIRVAVAPETTPEDLVVPGHIFPLKARSGGVLQRAGHTEGSIDLVRLAGVPPSAVICEIMNDDGTMARRPDLDRFAAKHGIPIVTIADIIAFRLLNESLLEAQGSGTLTTEYGEFRSYLFKSHIDELVHLVLVKGENLSERVVDVRVHRQRPLVDVFSSPATAPAGARVRLEHGLQLLQASEAAVLIYLSRSDTQAAFGEDFAALIQPAATGSSGGGTSSGAAAKGLRPEASEMDPRQLGVGAQILRYLGVKRMRVHMSRPGPVRGLGGFGLEVTAVCGIGPQSPETQVP